ncbi:TIGR04219 family outer membrane beta-barrel protein [Shewanella cyperi]|uniref:TIGR04219 family outer membrane beta-barrel protein n=1 Tax=Shewanella cyperi TaxID=2814292 RepID=UPI001A942D14|nr:TIGR04219 family outer membrane beta-barrel protein [Shewanella cyperi]QSX40296.1 TIGR04219 family outer membrane beta-barrel protein [Shewanella cyperi]
MKKAILATALLATSVSSAQGATVIGFKLGADYWYTDVSGTFADGSGQYQGFDYDSSAQTSLWVAMEHPVPALPNVMIRQNSLDADGELNGEFSFGGRDFNGPLSANSDLTNTDFVLYYELLDNDLVSLDLGAAYKLMDGAIRVEQNGLPGQMNIDSGIIMGYASASIGVPGLGLYGFADVLTGIDETSVYDYAVGLGWEFDGVALDTRVRGGYRDFNFDVNNFSDVSSNMEFKGFFAGVELVF